MSFPNTTIESLANETLSEIFILTLPSGPSYPVTFFPSPLFLRPSPTESPLLFCQISARWRIVAISDPRLWKALDVTTVKSSHLVELWLSRSGGRALALQTASESRKITTPPIHRHLALLLPRFSQCQHLYVHQMFIPPSDSPPRMPELQSLVIRHSKDKLLVETLSWFSLLASQAPRITTLFWTGPPPSSFPWSQLTRLGLSLNLHPPNAPEIYSCEAFENVLAAIQNVEFLEMDVGVDLFRLFASPKKYHTLLNVTTFSINCNTLPMIFLTLPNLQHLILGTLLMFGAAPRISDFFQRSQFAVTRLELRQGSLPDSQLTPSMWICPQISPSLCCLVIPSEYLNEFFLWANEQDRPGTLPTKLLLLRDVDRCFRIDDIDGIAESEFSGVLAAVIKRHLPQLTSLYLDDDFSIKEQLESAIVGSDKSQFRLWRSIALRQEYQAWWNSSEGIDFRAARATGMLTAVLEFDIEWFQTMEPGDERFRRRNRFAKDDLWM